MGKGGSFRLFFSSPPPDTFPGRQETGGWKEGHLSRCPVRQSSKKKKKASFLLEVLFLEGDQERDLTDFESGAADAPLPPPPLHPPSDPDTFSRLLFRPMKVLEWEGLFAFVWDCKRNYSLPLFSLVNAFLYNYFPNKKTTYYYAGEREWQWPIQ